jgi:RNA polymerase sigma factor (sigma-70 family)
MVHRNQTRRGPQRRNPRGEQVNQILDAGARRERGVESSRARGLAIRREQPHVNADLWLRARFAHIAEYMAARNWAEAIAVRKSGGCGVLLVNGDERGVLKLDIDAYPASGPELLGFDRLFTQFYAELFGLVYRVLGERMETEDTLQEAFLKLSDETALQSRPETEVGAWLRRVALNLAFNRLRSARRGRARLERVGRLEADDGTSGQTPDGLIVRREEREAVRRALLDVPERQRECLLLRHSGYSYAEIAATLGIALGSVGVLLARGEHAVRARYRGLEVDTTP